MQTIFTLLRQDLHNIFHSRPVLITLLAFCIIPAVYALLNIQASWDPYSKVNTSRMPIAVVNNDEGSTINGKSVNVGTQIVQELKKNHRIHWIFINDWQGNDGLDQGKYYSLIEIPDDFSSRLATLVTSSPQKPNIIYKSNEKLNAAATKITGQAEDTLAQEIKSNFTRVSTKEALKQMNAVGDKIDTHKPQILQIRTSLLDAIHTINRTQRYLQRVNGDSKDTQIYLKTIKDDLPKVAKQINELQAIVNHGKSLSIATKQTLNSARNNLSNGLNSLHSQTDRLQTALSDLQSLNSNGESPIATGELNQVQNLNNAMINQINNGLKVLYVINNLLPNNRSTTLIKLLASIKGDIHAQQKNIDQLKSLANSSKSSRRIRQLINHSSQIGDRIESTITNASAEFDATTSQNLSHMGNTLNTGLANENNVLSATQTLIPELKALANAGNSVSQLSVSRINSMNNRLNNIQDKLNGLNHKTGFINEKNLTRLVNALGESPQVSNLLSSPISLKTTNLYRLGKFGYGVTPFYTVLSMWIGVLLLTTIMAWKYRTNQGKRLNPNMVQGYCGKLLLYLCMTLGQTTITLFGEIVLLGIHPGSFLSMIAFAYLITLVFTIVIYTLVFMFGNIGKVISVLLMILQIFGTGGIYPLETILSQLAALAPFLPFTYAIQGLREAIAGPNWATFSHDILMLICLAITFIVIAPLRRIFKRPIDKLEKGMKNSRL